MATVTRTQRPEKTTVAPPASPKVGAVGPAVPEGPQATFRDRLALAVWLAGAALMGSMLI